MKRRFMGHLTTTSILMTLISLWQFCWKSLWDGRKILTYHPFSICSLTTVLVKTWTATCLLCWHFWSKRKVLRKYVILVNFKKKWICLIHISHKALFSSIKMSHCNVFKVHLGGKLVSIQSQFLQLLNECNLKLKLKKTPLSLLVFQIRVNFLPVGHTHEDIDAFFGVYSKHLDKLDIYTVTGKLL